MLGTASKIIILGIIIGACFQLAELGTPPVATELYTNLTTAKNPVAVVDALTGYLTMAGRSLLGPISLLAPVFDSNTPPEVKAIMLIFALPLSVAYLLAWLSWLRGKVL
ncbi:hypothetical protein [Archaeoglobus profundus]|uniref:Uncharacterized protein n=1 Tax=Archaeoglobus profundus (strain DSM 5631 / JCM 9629 / NBRC 100127 / Av18) TaxID=572546 RepID=D2RF33_ARCPA|nr:hypothetical protein [Archaeoglobus profundus]ADB58727.1 hypothetical protein Arcpr_1681 [Archaeoglobus profundus DSM 5631]